MDNCRRITNSFIFQFLQKSDIILLFDKVSKYIIEEQNTTKHNYFKLLRYSTLPPKKNNPIKDVNESNVVLKHILKML